MSFFLKEEIRYLAVASHPLFSLVCYHVAGQRVEKKPETYGPDLSSEIPQVQDFRHTRDWAANFTASVSSFSLAFVHVGCKQRAKA